MTRSGVSFYSPKPIQYVVRWRELLGTRGATILMAHNGADARSIFRRKYPHREIIQPVKPCRTDAPTLELAR